MVAVTLHIRRTKIDSWYKIMHLKYIQKKRNIFWFYTYFCTDFIFSNKPFNVLHITDCINFLYYLLLHWKAFNNTLQLCVQCEIIRKCTHSCWSALPVSAMFVDCQSHHRNPYSPQCIMGLHGRITSRHFGAVCVTSVSDEEEQQVFSVYYIT